MRLRASALERDFHILYGTTSRFQIPFYDGSIFGTIVSLGITTMMASWAMSWFLKTDLGDRGLVALAVVIFLFEFCRMNWEFLTLAGKRTQLRRKYLPMIEHTEAYELLEDAVALRRRGEVPGLGDAGATEAELLRLWKAAFAEADALAAQPGPTGLSIDPINNAPVGDQIKRYFEERAASYEELSR